MTTTVSSLSNIEPLLSCIVTLCTLILLYFPPTLRFTFSPVLVLSAVLLLSILRLGAVQGLQGLQNPKAEGEGHEKRNLDKVDNSGSSLINVQNRERRYSDPNPNPDFEESFVEWDVSAPLEVIYEEYEGEENGDQPNPHPTRFHRLDRYPSLSMDYPITDSDSSSSDGGFSVTEEWESPESVSFTWEEEYKEGSLIEIALDHSEKKDPSFHVEEDNFIEIDIFPCCDV